MRMAFYHFVCQILINSIIITGFALADRVAVVCPRIPTRVA